MCSALTVVCDCTHILPSVTVLCLFLSQPAHAAQPTLNEVPEETPAAVGRLSQL